MRLFYILCKNNVTPVFYRTQKLIKNPLLTLDTSTAIQDYFINANHSNLIIVNLSEILACATACSV